LKEYSGVEMRKKLCSKISEQLAIISRYSGG
jgi:hypothetical protein